MRTKIISILLFVCSIATAQKLSMIPQPQEVVWGKGVCATEQVNKSVDPLMEHKDGYSICINKKGIAVKAQSEAGMQYAEETLKTLYAQNGYKYPQVTIQDWPQYEWRGLMLDCSRHFYTLEYLKKQVDILAHYKMNRLHLHLTDDQGWRIEIKKYPELTQKGAWREFNKQDSICLSDFKDQPEFELDPRFIVRNGDKTLYGGFYTQEELRDLVKYAQERNVEIIPEIDMPGHTQAISAIHPEFTETGVAEWGTVFSVPLSPTKEEVYEYLQDILDEVMDIFPSHYIHIGADEVEKDTWKKSDACKQLMEREGIKTYEALQSYFVERIHKYIQSKGREMICWDDAIEGGLDSKAEVMYWRYWVGGVAQRVLDAGHHIIFTPGSPMYVARANGLIYDVYNYDGLDKVPADKQHLVRGGQVSLWGENMSNYRRADYCIYPRMVALSELLWTKQEKRNWKNFKLRLEDEKKWLDDHDVKYGKTAATLTAMQKTVLEQKQLQVTFDSEFANPDIRYTLDGTTPTSTSLKYTDEPICINEGEAKNITAAIMKDGVAQKPMFRRYLEYHKAIGAKVEYKTLWHESYKAAEVATLTDGKMGDPESFGDGLWQGLTSDLEVVVDLGKETEISDISISFMQMAGPGVFMPGSVDIALADEQNKVFEISTIENDVPPTEKETIVKNFVQEYREVQKARYIKVHAHNTQHAFIFADEIIVK